MKGDFSLHQDQVRGSRDKNYHIMNSSTSLQNITPASLKLRKESVFKIEQGQLGMNGDGSVNL